MMPVVLGMELKEACSILEQTQRMIIVKHTRSRTGVIDADSCRVIRQRDYVEDGKQTIELTVSDFKTTL